MIIESDANIIAKIAWSYYESVSFLMLHTNLARERKTLLLSVIAVPLAEHRDLKNGCKCNKLSLHLWNSYLQNNVRPNSDRS
jgi:hypothetical protein